MTGPDGRRRGVRRVVGLETVSVRVFDIVGGL